MLHEALEGDKTTISVEVLTLISLVTVTLLCHPYHLKSVILPFTKVQII